MSATIIWKIKCNRTNQYFVRFDGYAYGSSYSNRFRRTCFEFNKYGKVYYTKNTIRRDIERLLRTVDNDKEAFNKRYTVCQFEVSEPEVITFEDDLFNNLESKADIAEFASFMHHTDSELAKVIQDVINAVGSINQYPYVLTYVSDDETTANDLVKMASSCGIERGSLRHRTRPTYDYGTRKHANKTYLFVDSDEAVTLIKLCLPNCNNSYNILDLYKSYIDFQQGKKEERGEEET